MSCPMCRNGILEEGETTVVQEPGDHARLQGVPAQVCDIYGETIVTATESRWSCYGKRPKRSGLTKKLGGTLHAFLNNSRYSVSGRMGPPMLLATLACLFAAAPLAAQDRDNFNPPPTAPPIRGPEKKSQESQQKRPSGDKPQRSPQWQPLTPPTIGGQHFKQELLAYESEVATHPFEKDFAEGVAVAIQSQISTGQKIHQIVVTGYADGERNAGVKYDWNTIPIECRKNTDFIDDVELATLRGCVIYHHLLKEVDPLYAGSISWQLKHFDEPDGGKHGYLHRKTSVEITVTK